MEEIKVLLEEMFKRVGLTFDIEFVKQPEWYLSKSWTLKEEEDFRKWAVKTLKKKFKYCNIRAKKEVSWFLFAHGWKIE